MIDHSPNPLTVLVDHNEQNQYQEPILADCIYKKIGNDLTIVDGSGGFGKVYKAMNELTSEIVAIKEIQIIDSTNNENNLSKFNHTNIKLIQNEIETLKKLDSTQSDEKNHNILKYKDTFSNPSSISLVIEYCPGGNLLNYINTVGPLNEPLAAKIFEQIVEAVNYCHNVKHIAHRDLKPENILITTLPNIKIADFGMSVSEIIEDDNCDVEINKDCNNEEPVSNDDNNESTDSNNENNESTINNDDNNESTVSNNNEVKHHLLCTSYGGSIFYSAPEILCKIPFDPFLADIWSLGVILYTMISGNLPWYVDNRNRNGNFNYSVFHDPSILLSSVQNKQVMKQIMAGNIQPLPDTVSPDCKKLIFSMLQINPKRRTSISRILESDWLQRAKKMELIIPEDLQNRPSLIDPLPMLNCNRRKKSINHCSSSTLQNLNKGIPLMTKKKVPSANAYLGGKMNSKIKSHIPCFINK